MRRVSMLVVVAVLALAGGCAPVAAPASPPQPPNPGGSPAAVSPSSPGVGGVGVSPTASPLSSPGVGGAGGAAAPPIALRFAYSAISANTTPFWVALERGYFREAGFDVEALFLGASASMQALLADEVALGIVGPEGI